MSESESEYSSDGEHLARCRAGNSVVDSWETIHAKLQYEKHLQEVQELQLETRMPNINQESGLDSLNNSFGGYDSSSHDVAGVGDDEMSVDNDSNDVHPRHIQINSTSGSSASSNKEDLNSFGEINSRNQNTPIRPAIKHHSSSSSAPSSSGTEHNSNSHIILPPSSSPTKQSKRTNQANKSVFIKANDTIAHSTSYHHHTHHQTQFANNTNNINHNSNSHSKPFFSSGGMTVDDDDDEEEETEEEKERFRKKRAGHYNEFKVLQALRAKMSVDEDDEEDGVDVDDDRESNTSYASATNDLDRVKSNQKADDEGDSEGY